MLVVFPSSLNEEARWREPDAGTAGSFKDWFPVFCSFVVLIPASLVPCIGRLSMMYPDLNHPNLNKKRILMGQKALCFVVRTARRNPTSCAGP